MYGVELAISATNVSRGVAELLHVKTVPNYPLRDALRLALSSPLLLSPKKVPGSPY